MALIIIVDILNYVNQYRLVTAFTKSFYSSNIFCQCSNGRLTCLFLLNQTNKINRICYMDNFKYSIKSNVHM